MIEVGDGELVGVEQRIADDGDERAVGARSHERDAHRRALPRLQREDELPPPA